MRHSGTIAAIAAVLLACERADKLYDDWYQLLSEEILPRNLESLEEGKLSIISFNYEVVKQAKKRFPRYQIYWLNFSQLATLIPPKGYAA